MDPLSRAQSVSHGRERSTANLRPYKKGQSGNPAGRPKKQEITKIYEDLLRKSVNRKEIKGSVMKMLTSGRMVGALMLREMAERTEGKVVQPVEMGGNVSISLETVLEAKKKAGK